MRTDLILSWRAGARIRAAIEAAGPLQLAAPQSGPTKQEMGQSPLPVRTADFSRLGLPGALPNTQLSRPRLLGCHDNPQETQPGHPQVGGRCPGKEGQVKARECSGEVSAGRARRPGRLPEAQK